MGSVSFGIKNKIILLTALSMLGSNLFLLFVLLLKIDSLTTTLTYTTNELPSFLMTATIQDLAIMSLLFIIACTLVSYFFVRKLTSPLQDLVFASNQLGYDVSTINFPKDSNDELAALASSLEKMNKTIIKQNESLKNSELMNHSIMDNMSDGLITMTTDGMINTFNRAAEKLFGYESAAMEGKSITILMPEPYKTTLDGFFKQHLVDKLPTGQNDIEVLGIRKDNSTFSMELSLTEMTLQNRKSESKRFFIGLCRNIEERKKHEAQLKKAEKIALAAKDDAERANLAKSQFLSRMSHEFYTPLNAVMGFSQILLYDDAFMCSKQNIQSIYDAGESLLSMVNNVLDISNAEMGEMNVTLETVEVTAILKEVYQQASKLAIKHQNGVTFSIRESQAPVFIKADRERLKQVLLILLTNAIKFNRKPGIVVLSLRETTDQIGISVKDQGEGIAKENLELIFKPFERLDAYSMGIDGLGIGLAIAKQLTENMGGTIGVESEEKLGSLFYVFFPICKEDAEPATLAGS